MGFLTSLVENGEIISSHSYKIISDKREERNQLNYRKEQLVICSRAFWKRKNLGNVSLTFVKFQSIPTYSVSG